MELEQQETDPRPATKQRRRRIRRAVGALLIGFCILEPAVLSSEPVTAAPVGGPGYARGWWHETAEWEFLAHINWIRAVHGMQPLQMDWYMVVPSRQWAIENAARGGLSHRGSDRLIGEIPGNWTVIGENVGVGGSVTAVHQAFMASPSHAANILDPRYTHIGIGVYYGDDNRYWVTEYFVSRPATPPRSGRRGRRSRRRR